VRAMYKSDEEFHLTAFTDGYAQEYWIDMAVYDSLGGLPARTTAAVTNSMERYQTRRWFHERYAAKTPSEIVMAEVLEDEFYASFDLQDELDRPEEAGL